VEPPAVGFDDESLGGEEEVDLEAGDLLVDLRLLEAVGPAEGEHALLELALGEVGPGHVLCERGREAAGSSFASVRVDRVGEVGEVEELDDLDGRISHSAAADAWLSAAPGPAARTAAIQRA
jgi:hypothetical protein